METQDALTQTLYSQLQEEASAYAVTIFDQGIVGSSYVNKSGGHDYIYWQVKRPDGSLWRTSLGRDTPELRAKVDDLLQRKQTAEEAIDSLKIVTKAYVASGGMAIESAHFKVLETLARAGLFNKGVVLVGSHAFAGIGNMLGVRWGSSLKTSDMDFARPTGIALAIPDSRDTINVPQAVKENDPTFFEIPMLNSRQPSTSMMSRKTRVKIDFLTVQKNGVDTTPRFYSDLSIAAAPLRYMNYLMGGQSHRGLIIGTYPIPVNLPDPARFAVHKLVIAQERTLEKVTKSAKDIRQASEVIEALGELGKEIDLRHALTDLATECGDNAVKQLQKSVERMEETPRSLLQDQYQKMLLNGLSNGRESRADKVPPPKPEGDDWTL